MGGLRAAFNQFRYWFQTSDLRAVDLALHAREIALKLDPVGDKYGAAVAEAGEFRVASYGHWGTCLDVSVSHRDGTPVLNTTIRKTAGRAWALPERQPRFLTGDSTLACDFMSISPDLRQAVLLSAPDARVAAQQTQVDLLLQGGLYEAAWTALAGGHAVDPLPSARKWGLAGLTRATPPGPGARTINSGVLVTADGASGEDFLQLARLAPLLRLKGQFAFVCLEVPDVSLSWCVDERACRLVGPEETKLPPGVEYHLPLRQLPIQLGLGSLEEIQWATISAPPSDVSYMVSREQTNWLAEQIGDRVPVGVSWRPDTTRQGKGVDPALFASLCGDKRVAVIGLAEGVTLAEQDALPGLIVPPSNMLAGLLPKDRLALVQAIGAKGGRIMTVAQSPVAHMAGHTGVPTDILLSERPHWCWQKLGRLGESPWFSRKTRAHPALAEGMPDNRVADIAGKLVTRTTRGGGIPRMIMGVHGVDLPRFGQF